MTRSECFPVHQHAGPYPANRVLGRTCRDRLDEILENRGGIDLTIDFDGVDVMNISFADEFLGKFLTLHDFSDQDTTVKVTGLNQDNQYSIAVCVERRQTHVVVREQSGELVLLGDDPILRDTFEHTLRLGSFKANRLADAMGLSAQNANNRLKRLAAVGALRRRQITGSTRGGREYSYEPLPADVSCHDTVATA